MTSGPRPLGRLWGQNNRAVCSWGAFEHQGSPFGFSFGDNKQEHLSEKRKGRCGPLAQEELAKKQEDKIWDGVMGNLEYLLDGMWNHHGNNPWACL